MIFNKFGEKFILIILIENFIKIINQNDRGSSSMIIIDKRRFMKIMLSKTILLYTQQRKWNQVFMNVHIDWRSKWSKALILCKILDSLFESLCEHSDGYFREIVWRVALNIDNYDFYSD